MKLKTTIPFLGLLVLLSGCASTVEPDGYSQAAVISGASETTFYAMTVYYGSIGVKNTGCTLPAALLSDWVCYIAACRMVR